MESYVAGLDGGGTKTAVSICDLSGAEQERFSVGPVNYNGTDARLVEESMAKIFARLAQSRGLKNCRALCLGAAGISNPAVRGKLEPLIRRCGYKNELILTGDQQTALYGAMGEPCGVILIAGTGSICYGRNREGKECRTGGCGYRIDDGGSGYAIGREILSAAVRAMDGRARPTVLTALLAGRWTLTTRDEIVRFVYDPKTGKKEIASLAGLLAEAWEQKDAAAIAIARRCVSELYGMASPVVRDLELQNGRFSWAGGILSNQAFLRDRLLERLRRNFPELKCAAPKNDAAFGAAGMALSAALEHLH